MKKQIILLCALFMSLQQFIAQTTPLQKMDDFLQQKGDDFEAAYEKKDVKAYNALLSDYLLIYEKLSVDEKKQQSYLMSNIYYNLSCIYSISKDKKSALLSHLIESEQWPQALVFSRTKHGSEKIAKQLNADGTAI